ncbi:enoyl-CoA hydratase [Nitrobacter sp. JJSN]|uniref:enoyl-CoA hydratase n=1 Tax=Nitrobacter sp. JJSN TaxID=3453033 RepID=UPI003F75814B
MTRPARAEIPEPPPMLLRQTQGSIAALTLNRPEARNSLSEQLIGELHAAIDAAGKDPAVRAVVIAASGPAFSSGHDLKELTAHRADPDRGRAYFAHIMTICSAMMQAIVHLPKPVVACVQGIATAAGCQLVATCDLAVASEKAFFATPGVDIGLFCSTPMVALTRNITRKQAMEMLLTGEPVSAMAAQRMGLINRVVTDGTERDAALALAQKIARKSALTVKLGKTAFYRQAEMNLADAYRYAVEVMTENMMACDAEEGIDAFIEKRDPKWKDR